MLAAAPSERMFAPEKVFALVRSRLEHIPIGLNQSDDQEYAQVFEAGAISCRPNGSIRSQSALAPTPDAKPNEPSGGLAHSIAVRAEASTVQLAAVLVGLVAYPGEVKVILTQRAADLRVHSGQIAFPGGKIDAQDASPIAAALREAREEIGLDSNRVEPLGCLAPHVTGTGFHIVPVVAKITPPLALAINPREVDEAFEVPFAFLMNPANHRRAARELEASARHYYAMPYGDRAIWGVTASILRNLYERLYT